jgi:hypothetical protein
MSQEAQQDPHDRQRALVLMVDHLYPQGTAQ